MKKKQKISHSKDRKPSLKRWLSYLPGTLTSIKIIIEIGRMLGWW